MQKHFKKRTLLGKLFNRNTLKLSYSCCPKIKSKLSSPNRKLLLSQREVNVDRFNCQVKAECPMRGEGPCNVGSVIYLAEVSHQNMSDIKNDVGGTNDFKVRSYRH